MQKNSAPTTAHVNGTSRMSHRRTGTMMEEVRRYRNRGGQGIGRHEGRMMVESDERRGEEIPIGGRRREKLHRGDCPPPVAQCLHVILMHFTLICQSLC
ncbi:hypothetical protein RHMOL_Rhmol09G0136300 [Rhododendron molle]|uniref:Uncharacterized protein n=1 Tax=Rhododendron molle TaxID=49168 RepID=A0ACC0MD84_RHOML|nr:hypothetical protein RHMOL_Rhmol09G0136300 [Rhododendron molle]